MPTRYGSALLRLLLCLGCASGALAKPVKPLPPAVFPLKANWTVPLAAPFDAPLATDGTRVFVVLRDGLARAFELHQGKAAWQRQFPPGTVLSAGPGLLLAREPDGFVSRLEPSDGSEIWRQNSNISGSLPAVLDEDRAFVAGDGIAALATADGRPLWGAPGGPGVLAPPVREGDAVYVVEEQGQLRARRRVDGTPLWSFRAPGLSSAAVAADERRVYLGTTARAFFGLSASKGRSRWRRRMGADVQTRPTVAGKLLLVASHENVLYALSSGNGHLTWRVPLPSRPLAGPLVFGEAVLAACRESDLVGFDLRTGAKLGALRAAGEIRVAPLLAGEQLLLGLRAPWSLAALGLNLEPRTAASPAAKGKGARKPAPPTPAPAPSPSPSPSATPSPEPSP